MRVVELIFVLRGDSVRLSSPHALEKMKLRLEKWFFEGRAGLCSQH